jgi:hypothetical protein
MSFGKAHKRQRNRDAKRKLMRDRLPHNCTVEDGKLYEVIYNKGSMHETSFYIQGSVINAMNKIR